MSFPLMRRNEIEARHEGVAEYLKRPLVRAELADALKGIRDIERIESRVAARTASPLDLASLRESLRRLPNLKEWASKLDANTWHDLGGPFYGNGFTNVVYDDVANWTARFYRVQAVE